MRHELLIDRIMRLSRFQSRAAMSDAAAEEYFSVVQSGGDLPPIEVWTSGAIPSMSPVRTGTYILVDGFHRLDAYRAAGRITIPAEIVRGSEDEAFVRSLGVNVDHGIRRTAADKQNAVRKALADPVTSTLRADDLAKICGVSRRYFFEIKRRLSGGSDETYETPAGKSISSQKSYYYGQNAQAVVRITKLLYERPDLFGEIEGNTEMVALEKFILSVLPPKGSGVPSSCTDS